jgi:hypothetical protein
MTTITMCLATESWSVASRHGCGRWPSVLMLCAIGCGCSRLGWDGTQRTAGAFCKCGASPIKGGYYAFHAFGIGSAGVLMMAGTAAWAQSSTAEKTPGHIMQRTPQAKSTRPGASEYAPGHLKRKSKSQSASRFTPSHRTTPTTTGR